MKFIILIAIFVVGIQGFADGKGAKPKKGGTIAPITKEQALQIAEEKIIKTYGKGILVQQPLMASIEDGNWTVIGTVHCQTEKKCQDGPVTVVVSEKNGAASILKD